LNIAQSAARKVGIPANRVILFCPLPGIVHPNVQNLVAEGLRREPHFVERKLNPGEAKTKIALLSFSSGTTGKPKVYKYSKPMLIALD
jgi:4-coumarate--CoA ligase